MEGAANGADGQIKQTKKDYVVAAKVTIGILTLGYSLEGLMLYEAGAALTTSEVVLGTGQTVFAADDVIGNVTGAAKNDIEGEYKPLKLGVTNLFGNSGAVGYDVLNLGFSGAGTVKDFKDLPGDKSKLINLYLDGYGATSGAVETSSDIKDSQKKP